VFDSPKWTRKRVQKLRRKGKLGQAIDLQRQLCQSDTDSVADWEVLADLAHEGAHHDLELAARVQVAKTTKAGPDVWVALATQAKQAGFHEDAVEATFRAADAAARLGDCRRALELCDDVLALAPEHRPAKRIRGIMERRVAVLQGEEEETWRNWPPKPPEEEEPEPIPDPVPDPAAPTPKAIEPPPLEVRLTKRIPGSVASEISRARSAVIQAQTPAPGDTITTLETSEPQHRIPEVDSRSPDSFVFEPQTWPSVLDWNCLMFVGGIDRIDEDVLSLADAVDLPAKVPIYEQGRTGQLLYCLDQGEVRAFRHRGIAQDFGAISAGSFFGEVSTITGFPSTATVSTQGPCKLRVFTREKFQRMHRDGEKRASKLLSFLRTWYMEVAANLSPLLSHCSPDELGRLADSSNWTTFQAGHMIGEEGQPGDLYTIIAGLTSVTRAGVEDTVELGYLTTGDLVGAMSPSPVTVSAVSLVFALKVDREQIPSLSPVARTKLEEHVAESKRVLKWLDEEGV